MKDASRVGAVIMGEEYVIRGDAPGEYIENLARDLDLRMRKLSEANPRLSLHQTAVLLALNLADELSSCHRRCAELLRLLEQV
ncbi:MAG TPA: cell division protein ZapA [Firmicutes bacterium]|nr:cell division protein ZapA [Bacillota bacterium]HBK61529.1 cell division protein ZapA [Bacillota bacterium]